MLKSFLSLLKARVINNYNMLFIIYSLIIAFLLVNNIDSMNPDLICCDHLFYRAQAVSWLNLNELQYLKIPEGNRLNEVYDFYYYDRVNTLTNQPPYVYRIFIPLLAGIIGKMVEINLAFFIINVVSLIVIISCSSVITFCLTKSKLASLLAPVLLMLVPEFLSFYIFDYMLVDLPAIAVFFLVTLLLIKKNMNLAFWVSAIVAPLIKETLLPLTLVVLIFMALHRLPWRRYLIFSIIPIVIQILLRLNFQVKDEPEIQEIYQLDSILTAPKSLFDGFNLLILLFIFSYSKMNRNLFLSLLPQFIFIFMITSSSAADGKRIWWTITPLLILAYCNLFNKVKSLFGNKNPKGNARLSPH
jgi:hypothetical protein